MKKNFIIYTSIIFILTSFSILRCALGWHLFWLGSDFVIVLWPLSPLMALMAHFRLSVLDHLWKRSGIFQKLLCNPAICRYDLRLFDMKGNSLLHKMARFR